MVKRDAVIKIFAIFLRLCKKESICSYYKIYSNSSTMENKQRREFLKRSILGVSGMALLPGLFSHL